MSLPRVKLHASLRHPSLRSLLEPKVHSSQFVWPIFVTPKVENGTISADSGLRTPNLLWGKGKSGKYEGLIDELIRLKEHGLRHVMIFGSSDVKDATGSSADNEGSSVLESIKAIRSNRSLDQVSVMADVCLCAYTSHGHCGILHDTNHSQHAHSHHDHHHHDSHLVNHINNSQSITRLADIAYSYASEGVDVVCPSDMMDSRIGAIRDKLDEHQLDHVQIMSYTSKKASVLYGPFRDVVGTALKGNRKEYQQPVGSSSIAIRALKRDLEEGADIVLVKPSLMYTDIIKQFAEHSDVPVAAYVVSGEYKMLYDYGVYMHKGSNESFDDVLSRVTREAHLSLARAGAKVFVSYFTPWLLEKKFIEQWNDPQ